MKVLVTTYNAAAKVPIKGEDLTPLLALDQNPDIISMGFEEIGKAVLLTFALLFIVFL